MGALTWSAPFKAMLSVKTNPLAMKDVLLII
jgi:hypothetical protein